MEQSCGQDTLTTGAAEAPAQARSLSDLRPSGTQTGTSHQNPTACVRQPEQALMISWQQTCPRKHVLALLHSHINTAPSSTTTTDLPIPCSFDLASSNPNCGSDSRTLYQKRKGTQFSIQSSKDASKRVLQPAGGTQSHQDKGRLQKTSVFPALGTRYNTHPRAVLATAP